ncbi:hypothetical protein DES53_104152 [Roseimicrobium gellanilyticum]|uniref:Uncharacterized protein n=2 Tax=Roseimicrobium gellanilyticum TaxID=748857 RepID=A0A366HMV3_9BACT|nr:hypothetical protein DES53_104152 [Roseimicrobium gellanilyticum]
MVCLGLAIPVLVTALALRKAAILVLRVKPSLEKVLVLTLLMGGVSTALHWGVGRVVADATQDSNAILFSAFAIWTGAAVIHITVLAFSLQITLASAIKVYLLMLFVVLVTLFTLATMAFLLSWLWMAVKTPL